MTFYGSDGIVYTTAEKIGGRGEGNIFKIENRPDIVCKIFHRHDRERDKKVELLCSTKWSAGFCSVLVVPKTVLYDFNDRRIVKGYTMKYIKNYELLPNIYSESHRLSLYKRTYFAIELCRAIMTVHSETHGGKFSIVMGDLNASNIMVDRASGKIRIVDVDSLHIYRHIEGNKYELFRCMALDPNLFMPELKQLFSQSRIHSFAELSRSVPTFSKSTDYYCMAFHLHMLLTGCMPFGGAYKAERSVNAPTLDQLSFNGQYIYSNRPEKSSLPEYFPDFRILSPELQELFIRTFQHGAANPAKRGTAAEFYNALIRYIRSLRLVSCRGFDHYLPAGYSGCCEWCRIEKVISAERKLTFNDIKIMSTEELKHVINMRSEYRDMAEFMLGCQMIKYDARRHDPNVYRSGIEHLKISAELARSNGNMKLCQAATGLLHDMK